MFVRAGNYPADKYTLKDIMAVSHAQQELWIREDDYATVNGFIDILDVSRLTTAHFASHTPNVIRKMLVFAEKAIPLRQRATHFINFPPSFYTIFNMLKPLMPAKQQERVSMKERKAGIIKWETKKKTKNFQLYVHDNNLESLYTHVPQKYLPKEYGGENGSLEEITQISKQFFLDRRDYLHEDLKYRNNESLRKGKQPDYEGIFGVEGSFRKLDVD